MATASATKTETNSTKVNGRMVKNMASAPCDLTWKISSISSLANGMKTKCMAWDYGHGAMAPDFAAASTEVQLNRARAC